MVKLRGVNVWPEALGDIAQTVPGTTNDFFVRAVRRDNRDELILSVVSDRPTDSYAALSIEVSDRLKDRLGVSIGVEVVAPGSLNALTEVDVAAKLKRFRDERPGPG
jgi:phenylacetate-CoA ligase